MERNTNLANPIWFVLVVGLLGPQFTNGKRWEPQAPPGEKLINDVQFRGRGTLNHLQDKDSNTAYAPNPSTYPHFWVDLKGLYNITTIQMLSQNNHYNKMNGINTEFQIYTSDQFMNPCRPPKLTGWKVCQANAMFTSKGEVINFRCSPEAAVAQYVLFSRGSPQNSETILGPYAAEIWFYGEKISDSTMTPEPVDKEKHQYLQTQEELLTGVNPLEINPSYARFTVDVSAGDVVLGCHDGRISVMAARRGNGRIVVILGTKWLYGFYSDEKYAPWKKNLAKWLAGNERATFVNANYIIRPGNIIMVKRDHKIDPEKIKNLVLNGSNSLLVSYDGNRNKPNDKLTVMLKEMGITVIQDDKEYGDRVLSIDATLGQVICVPQTYKMKLFTESWELFRVGSVGEDLTVLRNARMAEIRSTEFQDQLKQLLSKYYSYFQDRHPCEGHYYNWEKRTQLAWYCYNQYAIAQKSANIITLPGAENFPGLAKDTEVPTKYTVTIQAPKAGSYYPLGAFVNAGQRFKWKVHDHSHNIDNYYLTVSCHKDNVKNNQPWRRWPVYLHGHQLSTEDSYASPIGGVLFMGMSNDNQNITLELENVYRHPWYDIRNQTSVDDWDNERQRYLGVPWMAFMGDAMHTCLPVSEVVKLNKEDMFYAVRYYDNVVKTIHNFRGTNFEEYGFQVFATDVQLSGGWGHAGIPIMGYLPWAEAFTKIRAGYNDLRNGMTHEIGHNLQVYACTFKHGGEVSNNVYHFPVFAHLLNKTAYTFHQYLAFGDGEMKEVARIWRGNTYEGVNLGYYNWLGITFGEGLLMNLFSAAWGNRSKLGSEDAKVNFWLSNLCEETQFNVLPWQELWHFNINEETRKKCEQYPCFFPRDDMTELVKDIVDEVIAKQPKDCVRETEKKVQARNDISRGINGIRPQFTFFN